VPLGVAGFLGSRQRAAFDALGRVRFGGSLQSAVVNFGSEIETAGRGGGVWRRLTPEAPLCPARMAPLNRLGDTLGLGRGGLSWDKF
jgi:hypothetical protein